MKATAAFVVFCVACALASVPGVPDSAGALGLAVCLLGGLAYRETLDATG